eukprot:2429315-Rhodomonas_salina.1
MLSSVVMGPEGSHASLQVSVPSSCLSRTRALIPELQHRQRTRTRMADPTPERGAGGDLGAARAGLGPAARELGGAGLERAEPRLLGRGPLRRRHDVQADDGRAAGHPDPARQGRRAGGALGRDSERGQAAGRGQHAAGGAGELGVVAAAARGAGLVGLARGRARRRARGHRPPPALTQQPGPRAGPRALPRVHAPRATPCRGRRGPRQGGPRVDVPQAGRLWRSGGEADQEGQCRSA